jgi:hypothetical protein
VANDDYVEPLTGEEIIIDLCSQLAEKLRQDCNLRETDSYENGYSAKITVHLEAFGLDTAAVDVEVSAGNQQGNPENPDELLDTTYEIPAETSLNKVRERSDQPVPTLTNEGGQPVVKPRRYVRSAQKVEVTS